MEIINIDDKLKDRLKDFFNTIEVSHKAIDGWHSLTDDKNLLINCLIHQMQTGENILQEYLTLKDKIDQYRDFDRFFNRNKEYSYWQLQYDWDTIQQESIQEIDELLNNNGYWKIPDLLMDELVNTKKNIESINENQLGETHRQERHKEVIDRYYDYTFIDCQREVKQAKKDIGKLQLSPMDQVPIRIDFYPVILMVFDQNRNIINIYKIEKNLEGRLERLNNKYPSYTYGYLSLNEKFIDHVLAELCVYYNPKDLSTSVFSNRQSPYKSLGTIKQRFKGEMGIDLRLIKKVCAMYKIDIHYLNNNNIVVDRNKINRALSEYIGRDFTKYPNNQ